MDVKSCIMQDQYSRIQGAKLSVQNKTFSIYKGVNIIGRNKSAAVDLKNLNVSQYHAMIIIVDDSQHFVSDLNSSNGTYLFGNKITPFKLYELSNDTEINFGDVTGLYFKVPKINSNIHLESESMEQTQNLSQTFYAAKTQLMLDDSALNQTIPNKLPQQNIPTIETQYIHEAVTQDIHEAATQAIQYPPILSSNKIIDKNMPITTEVINNLHNDPTQVITMPQFRQPSTSTSDENIHEDATQLISFSQRDILLNQLEENTPEMTTNVVFSPLQKNNINQKGETPSLNPTVTKFDENKPNLSAIQDSVIEESVIEESVMEDVQNEVIQTREEIIQANTNENSNESLDFLTIDKPPDIETQTQITIHHGQNGDKSSSILDAEDIVKTKKRLIRKLSSSEDLLHTQKSKETCNSDSETDIEDVDIEELKRKPSKKLSSSQSDMEIKTSHINSHSDNEDVIQKQANHVKVLNSDSETDIDDNDHDIPTTQSDDVIKPKVLSRKLHFNSDSETDIEDNNENEAAAEIQHNDESASTEILNDTDCIPATQDAFANMFQYKISKLSNPNINSGNVSSEESFKLGLTELMIDDNDTTLDQANKQSEENSPIFNEDINQVNEDVSEINKVNNETKLEHSATASQKENNKECHTGTPNVNVNNEIITTVTSHIDMNKTKQEEDDTKQKENTCSAQIQDSELKNSLVISNVVSKEKETEDAYIVPTQKINDPQLCNRPENILSMATQLDNQLGVDNNERNTSEDFYMMPTQNMDGRQGINTKEEAIYSVATQNVNQLESAASTSKSIAYGKDADEDVYMMSTQVIDNSAQSNERNKVINNITEENDDKDENYDLYMMPTQKINEDDANFKAPQRFTFKKKTTDLDGSLTTILGSKSQDDPYSVETQKIDEAVGTGGNKTDIYLNKKPNIEKNTSVDDVDDVYLQPTQELKPVNHSNKENDLENDPYLIETQQVNQGLATTSSVSKNDSKVNDLENDPYLIETQQVNQGLATTSSVSKNDSKGKICMIEAQTELYISANQKIIVQKTPSNQNLTSHENFNDPYDIPTQPLLCTSNENMCYPIASNTNDNHDPQANKVLIKVDKQDGAINSSLKRVGDICGDVPKMKRIKKSDMENLKKTIASKTTDDAETLSQIAAFVNKPLHESIKGDDCVETISQIEAFIKKPSTSTKTTIESGKSASTKNPKEDKDIIQESETLSQIETFIKQPWDKVISPPNKTEEPYSISRRRNNKIETGHQIHTPKNKSLVPKSKQLPNQKNDPSSASDKDNKDINSKLKKVVPSKQVTRKTQTRQSKIVEEDKQHITDNSLKPVDNKRQGSFSEESDEEKLGVNSDKNNSKLNSEHDTVKSDINQSFALLEAKSTKTRKSQRITNTSEIKVAVPKNRRSMTTSSIAELPENQSMGKKPSTRKSRRILNNSETLSADTKLNDSSQQKREKDIKITHKLECSDSDFSEHEIPTKIMKLGATRRGKTNAKIPLKTGSKVTSNEETNENNEFSIPSTSKARMKPPNTDDSESNDSEKSTANYPPPSTPSRRGAGKRTANIKNNPTPTTSKVRVSSRVKNQSDNGTESSSCDSESISSNGPVLATPSRRARTTALHDTTLTMSERSKRKLRPKVVFTMLDSPQMESLIRQLGGSIVNDVDSSTVLVTEHIKRSQKLLTAVGQGKPICSPSWIYASKKANEFLDPWDFILTDKEAESKWNFSLKEAITKATAEKLFTNYTFQLMVSNAADVLKGAIEACGGKCVKTSPKNIEGFLVVVASPENKNKYLKIKKQNPAATVVEPEAIFDGVLRQELRLGRHLLT